MIRRTLWQRAAESIMAWCLATMAGAVFLNVVLRYGFGNGIAASEELSRLLFVWMVFIGATVAYPLGEHMAFTALLRPLQHRSPQALSHLTRFIHLLVAAASGMVAWGSWQQLIIGMRSTSVVLGYPMALLPMPAFLCATAICGMALLDALRNKPVDFGHASDIE